MKKKYIINNRDYFLKENQILKTLEKLDKTYITNGFLMDYEDQINFELREKIQELLDNQEGYINAMSFENKVYYDQLERTSNDPEIK